MHLPLCTHIPSLHTHHHSTEIITIHRANTIAMPSTLSSLPPRCVAVYCSLLLSLLSVAVCCSLLQSVAVCCSVLQCVAVCCSVLQYTRSSSSCQRARQGFPLSWPHEFFWIPFFSFLEQGRFHSKGPSVSLKKGALAVKSFLYKGGKKKSNEIALKGGDEGDLLSVRTWYCG